MYSHISIDTKSVVLVLPIVPVTRSLFDDSLPANTTAAGLAFFVIPPVGAVPLPGAPVEPVLAHVVAPAV
jgi:hypothetical protein